MRLFAGVEAFFKGARLAFSRPVLPFVLIPAGISLLVIVSGLAWAFSHISNLGEYLQDAMGIWPEIIRWLLEPLLYLIGLLVGAWLFGFLAVIVGSPFLGDLALRVDPQPARMSVPWWRQIGPSLAREMRKLRYTLPRLVGLLLLGLVPLINALAPVLWLAFGAWLMAVQFCDYALENRDQPFTETLALLRRHRGASLGFGVCATVGMSIPLLNFVIAPIAVVGGALLVRRLLETRT